MTALRLENVGKRFGAVAAVSGCEFEVRQGEWVCLVGESGCGKTTLLRLIAGLERADDGVIRFDGQRVNEWPPERRDVGMVFQDLGLYPHLSARENLAFGLQAKRRPRHEIDTRVHELAAQFQLESLLDRYPDQLSGGQRQRLAIARCLARQPRILLFDEPLAHLDAPQRTVFRHELRQLHRNTQVTTVFVTHDQAEALSLGDRVAVMHAGRIVQMGTPREIYGTPRNRLVASMIGDPVINQLPARLERHSDHLSLMIGDCRLPLTEHSIASLEGRYTVPCEALVGIRPEGIRWQRVRATDWEWQVQVDSIEPRGADDIIHLQWNGHRLRSLVRAVDHGLHPAETRKVYVAMSDVLIFDEQGALIIGGR